jgi:hypothetical protein
MPEYVPGNDTVHQFFAPPFGPGPGPLVLARQNYIDVPFGWTLLKDPKVTATSEFHWMTTYHGFIYGRHMFHIRWAESPNIFLMWGPKGKQLGLSGSWEFYNGSLFWFDIVDGGPRKFFSNTVMIRRGLADTNDVVDISEERYEPNNPVIVFPENGGSNQVWGMQQVS